MYPRPLNISRACIRQIATFFAACCCLALANAQTAPPAAASEDQHVGRGYEALRQDRYDAAVEEFNAALLINPKLALRARFPLGVALFELHKRADARREFETVQHETGKHPNVSYYLGRLDLEDRNFKAAVRNLTAASAIPPFPDTAYYLGFAYFKLEDWTSAENWLLKAAKDLPHDARVPYQLSQVYRKQGRERDAQNAATLAEDIRRHDDEASQLRNDCARKLDQGPLDEARKLCDQLYDPDDADKLTALGALYAQHGDLESALKPLTRAAQLSPQSPQMQYNLALADYQLTRFEEAKTALAPAIERWPDLSQINALYGAIQLRLGAPDDAYAALHHAYQINPRESATGDLLFEACLVLARKNKAAKLYAEALSLFQEAAEVRPVEPMPHREMVDVYRVTGKPDLALKEEATADQLTAALSHPQ